MMNQEDGRLHFSDLKRIAQSPAHYAHGILHPKKPTTEMLIGSAIDAMVFRTRAVVCYPGKVRNGKEWEAFRDAHPDSIALIHSEYEQVLETVSVIQRDPVAQEWLTGEHQVWLRWDEMGFDCATGIIGVRGGIDVLNTSARRIADLKVTHSAEPERLDRHILNQDWHTQLRWYERACEANGVPIRESAIVAVEVPICVTVKTMTDETREFADKRIHLWLERLKACRDADRWPGYVQSASSMIIPEWAE